MTSRPLYEPSQEDVQQAIETLLKAGIHGEVRAWLRKMYLDMTDKEPTT